MAEALALQDVISEDQINFESCVQYVDSQNSGGRKRKATGVSGKSKYFRAIQFTDPYVPQRDEVQPVVPTKIKHKSICFPDPVKSVDMENSESSSSSMYHVSSDDEVDTSSKKSSDDSSAVISDGFAMPESFVFDETEDEVLYTNSRINLLPALSMLMSWLATYPGLSKEAFRHLLYLLHNFILPTGNKLPSSYTSAYSIVKQFLVEPEEFHACVNDCVLFRNEFKDLTVCPICGSNRYKENSQIAQKRFKYLPLIPRIRQMFASPRVAELLQSHSTYSSQSKDNLICDVHDSSVWKSWYAHNGYFAGDARGLSFALCADGLNPFSKEKTQYSMWPIMLKVLNYPNYIYSKTESVLLVGIIPGRKEPKSLDPYLAVLIDEIQDMSNHTIFDSFKDEYFNPKANVVIQILDYPGQNKMFHCNGAGAYSGCVYCRIKGEYSSSLRKMVYLGHRRFLSPSDPLHDDIRNFPCQKDKRYPPRPKNMEYINKYNEKYDNACTAEKKKRLSQRSGCKGRYVLATLSYHDRVSSTPVEPMHLIKNISEHLVRLLTGLEDSHHVREEEEIRKQFRSCWVKQTSKHLPPAPFSLTKDGIKSANDRARSVRVPSHFDWRPRDLFTTSPGMKSHEWKEIICSGVLKFCVRDLLGSKQQASLLSLCDVLTRLYSHQIRCDESLEVDTHRALALIERDFLVSINVIVFHLLHHLPYFIKRFGPVHGYWMYSFERFNSWISRRVKNRRYPEATVIETYRLYEWSIHLYMSGKLPTSFFSIMDFSQETNENQQHSSHWYSLSDDQLQCINKFYRQTIPEYDSLCSRYDKERERARKVHALRRFSSMIKWVPLSGPSLSANEKLFCYGPSKEVNTFDIYSHKIARGRVVKFLSENTSTTSTCSSVVSTLSSTEPHFGSILYLFSHSFCGHSQVFANVKWYGDVQFDAISSLFYVYTNSSTDVTSIVSVTKLMGPLVTAFDSGDCHKLWILNFNQFNNTM